MTYIHDCPAINLFCDGACEPKNPGGVASFGWIIYERGGDGLNVGRPIAQGKQVVADGGKSATNNYAEYCGLGFAIRYLKDIRYRGSVYVYSDSKLLVHQVTNEWKCKKKHLQRLRARIWQYADEMGLYRCTPAQKRTIEESKLAEPNQKWMVLQWVPRESNKEADALSKQAFVEYQREKGRPTRVPSRPRRQRTSRPEDVAMRCEGCGWEGTAAELENDDDKDTFVCPICQTIGVVVA